MRKLLLILLLLPVLVVGQIQARYDIEYVTYVNDSTWTTYGKVVDPTGSYTAKSVAVGDKIVQRGVDTNSVTVFDRYVIVEILNDDINYLEANIRSDFSTGVKNNSGGPLTGSFPIGSTTWLSDFTYKPSMYQSNIDPDYDAGMDNLNLNDVAPIHSPSFTGNVGIGTTNPSKKLDVTGGMRVSDTAWFTTADTTSLATGKLWSDKHLTLGSSNPYKKVKVNNTMVLNWRRPRANNYNTGPGGVTTVGLTTYASLDTADSQTGHLYGSNAIWGQWIVAAGPKSEAGENYPPWGRNVWSVAAMEINLLNRYKNEGYREQQLDWTDSTNNWQRSTFGLHINCTNGLGPSMGPRWNKGYDGTCAFMISGNMKTELLPYARWNIGMAVLRNSITPQGTALLFSGGTHDTMAPNIDIKFRDWHKTGIDFSPGIFSGSVIKMTPTQTITDGTITKTLSELAAGSTTDTSQWLNNGYRIYYNDGFVGLNNGSPTQRLDVVGNIKVATNGDSALISTYKGANANGKNIFIGTGGQSSIGDAGDHNRGSYNTSLGNTSLVALTTGAYNTAIGFSALDGCTTGDQNTAVGNLALHGVVSGGHNTAIGNSAGNSLVTGDSNVFIGRRAGFNALQKTDAVNSMALGSSTYTTASNQFVYGNTNVTQHLFSSGNLGISDLSPSLKLSVNDTTRALTSGQFIFKHTRPPSSLSYSLTGGVNNVSLYAYLQANGGATVQSAKKLILNPSGGSIGIGVTNPAYKLDVLGSIGARGRLSIDTSLSMYLYSSMYSFYPKVFEIDGLIKNESRLSSCVRFKSNVYNYLRESYRISERGNVLIGDTTDYGKRLYVKGTAEVDGRILANRGVYAAAPYALPQHIYCLGNSLTWSSGTERYEYTLGELLEASYPGVWKTVGLGIPGDNTGGMLPRLTNEVLEAGDAAYVIIWGGVNDLIGGISAKTIKENLQAMYTAAYNDSVRVIALTIAPFKGYSAWTSDKQASLDSVNTWIKTKPSGVDTYLDVYTLLEGSTDELDGAYDSGDHLHLNNDGYDAVGTYIFNNVTWRNLTAPKYAVEANGNIKASTLYLSGRLLPTVNNNEYLGESGKSWKGLYVGYGEFSNYINAPYVGQSVGFDSAYVKDSYDGQMRTAPKSAFSQWTTGEGGVYYNDTVTIGGNNPVLKLGNNGYADQPTKISFTNEGESELAYIKQDITGSDNFTISSVDSMAFRVNNSERMRISTDGKIGIGTTAPSTILDINGDKFRIRTSKTPSSATDTGVQGEICWDASYIYICTATNTWKRTPISTW